MSAVGNGALLTIFHRRTVVKLQVTIYFRECILIRRKISVFYLRCIVQGVYVSTMYKLQCVFVRWKQ